MTLLPYLTIDSAVSSGYKPSSRTVSDPSATTKYGGKLRVANTRGSTASAPERSKLTSDLPGHVPLTKPMLVGIPLPPYSERSSTGTGFGALGDQEKKEDPGAFPTQTSAEQQRPEGNEYNSAGKNGPTNPSETSEAGHLMICLTTPRVSRPRLVILDLKGFEDDAMLLYALRKVYKRIRGWKSFIVSVHHIRFVQFRYTCGRVAIEKWPSIPPPQRQEYEYSPKPAVHFPPFESHYLSHHFNFPGRRGLDRSRIYQGLPKLVNQDESKRFYSSEHSTHIGWGISLDEEISRGFLLLSHAWIMFLLTVLTYACSAGYKRLQTCLWLVLAVSLLTFFVLTAMCWPISQPWRILNAVELPIIAFGVDEDLPDAGVAANNAYFRAVVRAVRFVYARWRGILTIFIPWFCDRRQTENESESTIGPNTPHSGVSATGQRSGQHENTYVGYNPSANGIEDNDGTGDDDDNIGSEVPVPDVEAAELFLHIILPTMLTGKKQLPIRVTHLTTDYQLFVELNRIYRRHRRFWRAIFMVETLRPTKYQLFNRTDVRTLFDPHDLASTTPDPRDPPPEYSFSYHPASPIPQPPLLYAEQLTQLFLQPASSMHCTNNGIVYDRQCYERSPKRHGRLEFVPNSGFPSGYGFEFKESFDIKFIMTCELFIAFLAFSLAALYWGIAKEDQRTGTAFNIAMFVFVIGQFLYGVLLALGERFESWRV